MNYRSKSQKAQSTKKILSLLFIVILSLSLPSFSVVSATGGPAYWLDVQTLKANDLGVSTFSGLGYMPDSGAFFAMDSGSSELVTFTMRGDLLSSNPSALSATNPLNLTYNPKTDGIYSLSETQGLLEAGTELNGQPSADYQVPLDAYDNAQGITFNPQTGDLYILDAAGPTLVQISASNNEETSSLIQAEQSSLKGLAYNPQDDYLYVYSVDKNYVYAVDENGSIVSSFDFTALNISNFSGITFAPSSDSTDDPANTNLFLADSGTTEMDSQVIELDITAAETPQEVIDASLPSNLVQTINSYLWSPPNTDATGLEYLLTEDKLFISDADVEEAPAPYFADVNLWESTNTGTVTDTCDTTSVSTGGLGYSNEPTGLAANPDNGQRFIVDDNKTQVFVIDLGPDNTFCTSDDLRYDFDTTALGSGDPEGLAYGDGKLFISDGVDAEIYVIGPGPDGVFEGGDEVLLDQFDTAALFGDTGLSDPEGIAYHWERGTLFIASRAQDVIAETTIDGTLLNTWDIGPYSVSNPAGLAIGPGSVNPSVMNVYLSQRGVDNGSTTQDENDGRIFEINITPEINLSITKTDGLTNIRPGKSLTYTIEVSNSGPYVNSVSNIPVQDTLPAGLINVSWTCSATSGTCPANGTGNIDTLITLSSGGTATFEVTADVDLSASGDLVNTATVGVPLGFTDPTPSNNSATDTTTVDVNSGLCGSDTSLVACFPFEEGSGTDIFDSSSYYNDGTVVDSPLWSSGKVGTYALDLNGTSQYGTIPDDNTLDLTTAITLSAWIKPEQYSTQDLIKKAVSGAADGYELGLEQTTTTDDSKKVYFRINQDTNGNTYRLNSTTEYPVDGATWIHVAATFDGTTMKIYINGVLENSLDATGQTIASNDRDLILGAQVASGISSRWFMGEMDEVRIYNRALSLSEIQTLFGNLSPVAVDDVTYSTDEDTILNVAAPGVLGNDSDPDSDPITAIKVTDPTNGTLTLNANGSFSYTPDTDYNGSDSFTYKANDGSLDSNTATVTITVDPVNDAPVAVDDSGYNTDVNTVLNVTAPGVLGNDSDVELDTLSAIKVTDPAHGTVTLNADGSFSYTPNTNYNGRDSFTYKANDTLLDSNIVTVTINVLCDNDATLVGCWSFEEGSGTDIFDSSSYYNDGTVFGSPAWAAGQVGTYALDLNGTDQYGLVPDNSSLDLTNAITIAAWIKPEQFAEQVVVKKAVNGVSSGNGYELSLAPTSTTETSQKVYFRINQQISGNNFRLLSLTPYPTDGSTWMHVAATFDGTTMRLYINGVLNNSLDATGQTISTNARELMIGAQWASSTATRLFMGEMDEVRIYNRALSDGEIASLADSNSAPVAIDDDYSTDFNTVLNIPAPGVLNNDTDSDGDPLTAAKVSDPAHGTVTVNADGSFTYTPTTDYSGPDSFTYKANDGLFDSNTATVNITVNPDNFAPVAVDDNTYSTDEDTTLNITTPGVLANDTDTEGDPLTAVLDTNVSNGTLTLNPDGSFTYTPNADFNGSDSFTYHANDGTSDSNIATVTITVNAVNDDPVAADNSYIALVDTPLNVAAPGVLGNDSDVDGDSLTAVLDTDVSNGTLALNSDGSFTYTPTTSYTGPDSFTYHANDGTADSNIVTVNISVNLSNTAPAASDDSYSTDEDTPLNIAAAGVLTNDTDTEGDSLTAVLDTDVSNGTLTLNTDGSFSYTPNADYNGSDSFTYKANDGLLDSNVATVTITVNAVNDAPVAADDSYSTDEDSPLNIAAAGVLANDTDTEGNPLTAVLDTNVSNGTLTLNADGSFDYTPNADFNGSDSFTYHANDGTSDSNIATVTITVNPVNDDPVAADDSYSTNEDTPLTEALPGVLTNDTDVDGDSLTAVLDTNVSNGTLTLNADGSFTYTPNADYNGSDSFTYHANDGFADSNIATVTITVNAVNDAPVAADDSYSTDEDTPLNIAAAGVLANDTDTEGNPLTAVLDTDVSNGTLTLNGDGSFTYTPNADFNGSDSFTYHANDGTSDSNIATVTITVNPIDDVPVAADDSYSTDEDTALVVAAPGVAGNDTEQDGDPLTVIKVSEPTNGTLTLNADGSFTYTPNADYNGPDSFTYKLNDGITDSNVATVTIAVNPVNDAPVAADDSYSTDEDTPLTVALPGVLANDTDTEGNPLTAVLDTDVSNGTLTLNADGSFTYTPNADYNGPDSFTYHANDGTSDSNISTVTITVNPIDDVPVAADDSYSTDEDTALVVAAPGVAGNDTEQDGDPLTVIKVSEPTNGTLTLNSDGSFTYTPNADYNGPDSFTYKLNDGITDSNVATVTIAVNPINDAPVAVDDSYSTDEDTPLTVALPGVLTNDTDTEDNPLTAVLDTNVSNGTLTLNLDGSFTYTPNADYNGPDSFTYHAYDGTSDSNIVTVTITVNPIDDVPVAADDSYSMDEDTALVVAAPGVAINDTEQDGDPLTVIKVSDPANGTLTLNADGSFTYTPNADYNGLDSFTYKLNDGITDSNIATVTITVNPVNDDPVAADDSYSTDEDTALVVAAPGVLSNDTDIDTGDTLSAVLDTDVSNGTLTLNPDGSFTYTPNADFNGADSFTYHVNDGTSDSNISTVNITINPIADAPVAVDDSYSTDEDTTLNIIAPGVMGNDSDADGDPLTAVLDTDVSNGSLTLNADGSFTYTPNADFNGSDSFTYHANDSSADSNIATVTITVNAVNDAPVATDDGYSTDEDTPLTVVLPGVLTNDTDVDADTLSAVLDTDVSNGSLTLNADGSFTYTPNADFNGSDSFTYHANDGFADSNVVTVTIIINPVNDAPVAVDDSYSTDEDIPLTVALPGVLTNDTDPDTDPLNAVKVTNPTNGTLTLNADGSFTYTPNADYNGPDSFTYKANDGALDSNVATVTITINPVNDAPVAVNDFYYTDEDTKLIVNPGNGVMVNDFDIEGDSFTAILVTDVLHGTLSLKSNGSFSYDPDPAYSGPDSFTYKVNDGLLDSNVATVTISVGAINDPPVAVDDNYSTDEDTPLVVPAPGVISNDSDIEGDPLTAVKVTNPANGTLTLNADGSFTYTPNADYNGSDSFTYKVNDVLAESNIATVTITVNAVNDAPEAADDSYTTDEDTALVITAPGVLGNDSDTEGDSMTAIKVTDPANGTLTLNADGSFTYTPNADYFGEDSFTYKVNDGFADSNVATVTITVNSINDAPVAVDDSYSTDEDVELVITAPGVFGNDTDTEGDGLSAIKVTDPGNGTLTLNPDGSFTYTPNADYNGPDSFTYKANDGTADSNIATVTITVNAVNDAPVAADDSYSTDEDTPLTEALPGVLGNDTDTEGDSLTAVLDTDVSNGTLVLNSDGSFTYTPNADFNGSDSFTYTANDGLLDSNVATVTITVNAINDAPVAADDSYTTDEDTALVIGTPGVLGNDSDTEGDPMTAVLVSDVSNGTLTLNADGSFTYTPNADFNGSDSFTYTANDGLLDSNVATVTITVNAINDAPVAADDDYSTDEDTALVIGTPGVLGNDSDTEGDPITAIKVTDPANGTLTLNADGSFTYTPNTDYNGPDSFTYKVNDGFADSNVATVTITVNAVNDAPVATEDSYSTIQNDPLIVAAPGVLNNDSDTEGDSMTAIKVTDPANGSLTLNADGSFTYTPNADYIGPDSFTYKLNDGLTDSNIATVTITVNLGDVPPAKTTIIAPIGLIDYPAPEYQWEHVTNATRYRMAIRNSSNVIVVWKTFDAADICSGSLCTANPGNFLSNSDYTVLVQGTNSFGKSKWAFAHFTVDAVGDFPPGAAMIYYPIGTIADTSPEYEWEHLSNAEQYKLAVKDSSGTILVWKTYNAADICSGAFCKADPGTVLPDGDYTLLILPTNSLGNGTWTGEDFTVGSSGAFPPGATVIYSPMGTITDSTPTFQWKHLSTATQYKLAVKDPTKAVLIWKTYNAADICTASLCTVDPGIPLAPNDYSVWILATNSFGNGIWTYRYFTVE